MHTFHLPCEEMAPTLQDVTFLARLPDAGFPWWHTTSRPNDAQSSLRGSRGFCRPIATTGVRQHTRAITTVDLQVLHKFL